MSAREPVARRARGGTAVAAAVAVLLGSLALVPVFAAGSWLLPVATAVALVGLGGVLLRAGADRLVDAARLPARLATGVRALVPVGQALLVLCLLTAAYTPRFSFAGLLPTRTSVGELGGVLADGMAEIREQATPALPLTGLVALTTVFVALVALVVDLAAVVGRQPALGGLGLLVLYCVPVSTITGDIDLISFVAPAAGFGVLLWADQRGRLADAARAGSGVPLGTGTLPALRTGVVALVAGVLLPGLVPTLAEGSLAGGLGGGVGNGGSSTLGTALDPVAQLRGELNRPQPQNLLKLTASVGDPGYLRAVALDAYTADGWRMSNLNGEKSIGDTKTLVPLPPQEAGRPVTETITAVGHDDRFLPLPALPQSVNVRGGGDAAWRFDPVTGTVFGRNVTTAGRTYQVTAEQPEPTVDQLAAVPDSLPDGVFRRQYTQLPPLDDSVTGLVAQLTSPEQLPYQRVLGIYDYLTDRANGFVYSLSTAPGTTGNDLADFLRQKRGYCEQYAGAMAVLVRASGVPARVVLGYTPGHLRTDGTRIITTDDAHAWVEAWFAGLGWVTFDPTPIGAGRAVALPWAPRADATPDATTTPLAATPALPVPSSGRAKLDTSTPYTPVALPVTPATSPLTGWLAGAGLAVFVLLVAALPCLVRRRQRRARLADGRPAALWDELLATTTDLGIEVPRTVTARALARQLAGLVSGAEPAAVAAVRDLALAEERSAYGPPGGGGDAPVLGEALGTVRRGLLRTSPRRRRLAAALWPASTIGAAAQWVAAHTPRRPRSA